MPATRLAYGLRTLVEQVGTLRPDATFDFGDPDGLSVIREVTIDRTTGKWLEPLVKDDPRVVSTTLGRRGGLTIEFTSRHQADDASPFAIPEVVDEAVEQAIAELNESNAQEVELDEQGGPLDTDRL